MACGEPVMGQDRFQNWSAEVGVVTHSGQVLKAQISVSVNMSVACPYLQIRSPSGIGRKQVHGNIQTVRIVTCSVHPKSHVCCRKTEAATMEETFAILSEQRIQAYLVFLSWQDWLLPILIQVRVRWKYYNVQAIIITGYQNACDM